MLGIWLGDEPRFLTQQFYSIERHVATDASISNSSANSSSGSERPLQFLKLLFDDKWDYGV
jgi:hypothetical protein